jgi:hypothetical protein
MSPDDGRRVESPRGTSAYASGLLDDRIWSNEWRLIGMATGPLVAVVVTLLGSMLPTSTPITAVGFIGYPVAFIVGWIFAPMIVVAPWRWLPPVAVGIGIAAAFLGWLEVSVFVLIGGLVLAPLSGGVSLFASLAVAAAGIPFIALALVVTLPIAAIWALLIRGLAVIRPRNHASMTTR